MIRVLLVDDHPIVVHGLKQVLSTEPDIAVAGEAGSAREAMEQVGKKDVDVVVLDISLPDKSGLDLLDELETAFPKLRVLVLSAYPEEQFAVRALKSGACGYLTKKSAPEELVGAIRKVQKGGRYVSSSLAENLASYLVPGAGAPSHERLSNREFRVMSLIAAGLSTGEIAAELCISPSTVGTYRARVLEKMGMKTNADITRYALENKLID